MSDARRTILCVDDERIVLSSLKEQLRRRFDGADLALETAESGDEGLEVFDELREAGSCVPVVVSDQIMPGMRGDQFLAEVHRRAPKTLTVLLTGQAGADDVGAAVNTARLYRYIAKPWAESDLAMTIREAVRAWEAGRELERRNEELRETLEATHRFVPFEILEYLGRPTIRDLVRGDQAALRMTVMFCDIRSFTARSEQLSPADTFAFINAYLGAVGPVVRRHGGFVDKYLGDGLMALFPGTPDGAVHAGIEILAAVERFNGADGDRWGGAIAVGVGIHTGHVMLGVVGEEARWSGTVVSDAVNLAARLEGLTKELGAPLIISEAVRQGLSAPDAFLLRPLGHAAVKGKRDPVQLVAVDGRNDAG